MSFLTSQCVPDNSFEVYTTETDDLSEQEELEKEIKKTEQCAHTEKTILNGLCICNYCGMKMEESLLDNDTKYFSKGGTKEITRHHHRKDDERSLFLDLTKYNIPQRVIDLADEYYKQIIENSIYRSQNRQAIVFACVYHAYIDIGEPQLPDRLAKMFLLDKKRRSRGIIAFKRVIRNRKANHIRPIDFIEKILSDIQNIKYNKNTMFEHIRTLYTHLDKKRIFNGSNPYSVASGLVYYYLKDILNHSITKNCYSKIVNLTNVTFETITERIRAHIDNAIRIDYIKKCQV